MENKVIEIFWSVILIGSFLGIVISKPMTNTLDKSSTWILDSIRNAVKGESNLEAPISQHAFIKFNTLKDQVDLTVCRSKWFLCKCWNQISYLLSYFYIKDHIKGRASKVRFVDFELLCLSPLWVQIPWGPLDIFNVRKLYSYRLLDFGVCTQVSPDAGKMREGNVWKVGSPYDLCCVDAS